MSQTLNLDIVESFFNGPVENYLLYLKNLDQKQLEIKDFSLELQLESDNEFAKMEKECQDFENILISEGRTKEVNEAKKRFREIKRPWYQQSLLMSRAEIKPKGYPGDYIMLEGIYDNIPISKGIGIYLDNIFLNQKLANAVRSRKEVLKRLVSSELSKRNSLMTVLNIASGSCREWRELFGANPEYSELISLACIDNDKDSLEYSSDRLKMISKNFGLRCFDDNVIREIICSKNEEHVVKYGKYDLVYSIGLYDYLPDSFLLKLIPKQLDLTKNGGRMIMAFKDKNRYNPTCYDWVTDWKFQQRDSSLVRDLLNRIGVKDDLITSFYEPTNTVVFYEVRKD